ncbi:MAG: cyclic nucleotide-binding domain-containing protein [Proteobacteria bacterium]|nr:cyclic nucleotide-binding domain-containing protein [Pseudomonadota bacterium]
MNGRPRAVSRDQLSVRIERELFLRSISDVRPNSAQLAQMLSMLRDVAFEPGEEIYRRGEPCHRIYLITNGQVELRAPDSAPWQFSGSATIGILDAMMDQPYSRDAVAVTDAHALELEVGEYFEYLEDNYDLCQRSIAHNAADLFELFLSLPDPRGLLEQVGDRGMLEPPDRPFSVVERLLVLRRVRPLARASIQALTSLAGLANEVRVRAGDTPFRQGDMSRSFWMIAYGQVLLQRDQPSISAIRGAGEFVENYAAFGSQQRQFNATAQTDVTILCIHEEDLFDRMEEHFDLTRSVLAFLASERMKVNNVLSLADSWSSDPDADNDADQGADIAAPASADAGYGEKPAAVQETR